MTWRLLVAVYLSISFANACPQGCDCGTGDELEFYCSVGKATVIFNARNNEYANIKCEGTNFTCADLPDINLANNWPLSSLSIRGCSPSILSCMPEALKTSSVSFLTVKEGVAPLEGKHVENLGDVTDIMIISGPEKTIPVSVLTVLPSLRRLRITGTQITLTSNVFQNCSQLKFLELSDGELSEIPDNAFNGLSNLETLNIWGNNIKNIRLNSLRGLNSLKKLTLTTSNIEVIAAGALAHMPNLESISIFKNQLQELPPGLLYNLTQLENITIQSNDVPLKLHTDSLKNLPSLKNLIIEDSSANLPEGLLNGCDALQTINLSGNKITSLPAGIFKDLKNLERLDLSRNKIAVLDQEVFTPLKKLNYLDLNRNYLKKLPDALFSGLRNLNYVSIDDNLLDEIGQTAFLGSGVKTISLKSNKLTLKPNYSYGSYENFGLYSPFQQLTKLKNLYLNGNEIDTMFTDWRIAMTQLQELNLSGNNFTVLDAVDCQFISTNVVVDLRNNKIASLLLADGTVSDSTPASSSILLDDNPLMCDCRLYNLAMRLKGAKPDTVEPKFVVHKAKCAGPAHLKDAIFVNVSPYDLICDLPAEACFNSCSSCELRPGRNDLSYDCNALPLPLPTPEEYEVKTVSLKLRRPPSNIQNLHVQLLNLSNTGLGKITFSPSKTVKVIDFSNNYLTKIPMEFLESNTTLYLSNNRFTCDCWHSEDLAALKVSESVRDLDAVTCGNKLLITMDPSALCNNWRAAAVASVTFISLVIVVAIIAVIIYRNSHKILVYLIHHGICPCCFVEDPDQKEYDVFVSYAHKDRDYLKKLMPKLEEDFGLKTCVHYRDWYVGDFIPDQINRSVEKSRKTIILLSNSFLDSAYANMEFRAAHNLAMKEGKNRIILILLEDVSNHEKLSEELKAHMKLNTFLKWDDTRFTERLQRAVPLVNNKKFVWPEVFKQANEKTVKSGLDVHLNSDGQLVNVAIKDAV